MEGFLSIAHLSGMSRLLQGITKRLPLNFQDPQESTVSRNSSSLKFNRQEVSFRTVLRGALHRTFKKDPARNYLLTYALEHQHLLDVDMEAATFALQQIFEHLTAVLADGVCIAINTKESYQNLVVSIATTTKTIENINFDILNKVVFMCFDRETDTPRSFTVQQLMCELGGMCLISIQVDHQNGGYVVDYRFHFPLSEQHETIMPSLPLSSEEIYADFHENELEADESEIELRRTIYTALLRKGEPLQFVILTADSCSGYAARQAQGIVDAGLSGIVSLSSVTAQEIVAKEMKEVDLLLICLDSDDFVSVPDLRDTILKCRDKIGLVAADLSAGGIWGSLSALNSLVDIGVEKPIGKNELLQLLAISQKLRVRMKV